jgi:nucleotide-binding universal stress UspA family protein
MRTSETKATLLMFVPKDTASRAAFRTGGIMDQIKKILAPTDLSELSHVGIRYALNLAKAIDAEVIVYHVVDYDTLSRHGQRSTAPSSFQPPDNLFLERYQFALSQFLKDHVSDLTSSVTVRAKVELGTPHQSIVDFAKSERCDLIVISTHGKTGLRMTLGSVTEKVVQTATCPVLSIRPQEAQESTGTE